MAASNAHRGRWQAQGGGLERSESWAQASPLTAAEGGVLLDRLESGLSPREVAVREACFRKARDFVERAAKAGGLDAPYIRSFTAPADTSGRRVDIEIRAGRASVP